jgi:hypothetical protein
MTDGTPTTSYGTWVTQRLDGGSFEEAEAAYAEVGIDLHAVVNSVLPEGVVMLGNGEFIGPAYRADDEQVCDVCGRDVGTVHATVHPALADT